MSQEAADELHAIRQELANISRWLQIIAQYKGREGE